MRLLLLVLCLCLPAALFAQEENSSWYEVEALNPGLSAPPEGLDRSTPRAAVRSFVELSDAGRFDIAAHILNLSALPEAEQAARGPELAAQLASVIDRRIWVDWSALPGRPDAMIESEAANHPRAGQTRRNIGIQLVEIDGRAFEVRIARYKAGQGDDAIWLFTPQTVEDVPGLFAEYGPTAFESFLPDSLKQRVGALRAWEWVALPVLLALLGLQMWLTNRVVTLLAKRVSRGYLRQALDRAAMPLALVGTAFVANLVFGLVVSFSGPVTNILRPGLVIVMVTGVGIAVLRLVDAILDRVTFQVIGDIDDTRSLEKRELYTSIYALRRIVLLFMVGFAVVFVLLRLNLFASLGLTLLASAGVLTVLLGIAGQAVLGNIMASLQITLAKPVRIGDSILFDGHWAYVESIYFTFIRLRTWDERRIVVPVKHFVSQPFENWSVKDARIINTIRLWLDHSADAKLLREEFLRMARDLDGVIEPDQLGVDVTDHRPEGQEISFYVMSPDPSTGWEVQMRLREDLIAFIRAEHPDWWPRDRISASLGDGGTTRHKRAASAA